MTTPFCIAQFKDYFINIRTASLSQLDSFYDPEVVFEDPIKRLVGLPAVKSHFEKLNGNLGMGGFYFMEEDILINKAYLRWILDTRLLKPKSRIRVEGLSVVYFDELITQQKDFFDLGALVYENIPFFGRLIRKVKDQI